MKKLNKVLTVAAVILFAGLAFGQTQLTVTTLSNAITNRKSGGLGSFTVGSATGIVVGGDIYIDQELINVTLVQGTLVQGVRGYGGTVANYHKSGAPVVVIPAAGIGYALTSVNPQGACARGSSTTAASTVYLPIINTRTGEYSDCIGGYFVTSLLLPLNANPTPILNVSPGDTVYTSVNTNGVALAATTDLYCSSIDLLQGKWLTGIQMLNGTSVATDSRIYSLYDGSGTLLAVTGTIAAGSYGSASEYGGAAFTQLFPAEPGRYFTCAQPVTAAGTASIRMTLTQHNDWILGGILTITAGSAPATITAPTTFTSAQAPYSAVY